MDKSLADKINASGTKSYFAITGGGQTFIGEYLALGGASKSVFGINVPYSQEMFDEFVGKKPTPTFNYCSEEAARLLAVTSYVKALKSGIDKTKCYGFGVTCSLIKENERDGRENKVFVSVHCHAYTKIYFVKLKKNDSSRQTQEEFVKNFIENVFTSNILPLEPETNFLLDLCSTTFNLPPLFDLKVIPVTSNIPIVLFPGSFNNWHEGHKQIFSLAHDILGIQPVVELSMVNADKGILDYVDVGNRLKSLPKEISYIITEAATFKDKVSAIRSRFSDNPIIFVVGADTWDRIWDIKYAGPLEELSKFFRKNSVKFLAFGRDNYCNSIRAITYGEEFRIKDSRAEQFKSDISSTQIREGKTLNLTKDNLDINKVEQKINDIWLKSLLDSVVKEHAMQLTKETKTDIAPRQSCRFPTSFQTVDNVIIDQLNQRILLGRKNKDKNKWRFPGGFVDPKDVSLEEAAKRERIEEVGRNLECHPPKYAFSLRVNDERYKNSVDKVLTAVMINEYAFGYPEAGDDLDEVSWVNFDFLIRNYKIFLIDAHMPLAERIINERILSK